MNQFDASPSAMGYIYQVRYALLSALYKIHEVDDPDLYSVSLEILDDVAFEKNGSPEELLQLKYHGTPGNLTDRSSDIWKTLRIWAELVAKDSNKFKTANFYLLTTETIKNNTLASYLSIDPTVRDIKKAEAVIDEIISTTGSTANQKGYDAVSALKSYEKRLLLQQIFFIGEIKNISELEKDMDKQLRLSSYSSHISALRTRVEGAWFGKAIACLEKREQNIPLQWLMNTVLELREQFAKDCLPNDYDDLSDESSMLDHQKIFIQQLKLFTDKPIVLKAAQTSYWKSYSQIQRWTTEGLLLPAEKKRYLDALCEEWEAIHSIVELKEERETDDEKKQFAKELYSKCIENGLIPIRSNFTAKFVARGTYHQLADKLRLGWHPDYAKVLSKEEKEDA